MSQAAEVSHCEDSCSTSGQIEAPENKGVADTIPRILKERPQWVAWKSVPKLDGKKPTKVPLDVRTERGAQANNSRTWSFFDDVMEFIDEWAGYDHTHIDGSGVEITGTISESPGYFFSADDPFCGIDLDDCRDPDTGAVEKWALEIIEPFSSYTELSQSGTGFHIIIKGRKPDNSGSRKGGIECYDRSRYFVCTGHIFNGLDTIQDRQIELESFLEKYLSSKKQEPLNGKNPDGQNIDVDAQTVLDRALKSKKGEKIRLLLSGDNAGLPSDSEGDQSLCNYLVFSCGYALEQDITKVVDQIFRESKRMRPKWDEVHRASDRATYGFMTIEKAIADTIDRYQKRAEQVDINDADLDDNTPLWSFEDAVCHIAKHKDRDLTSSQKLELVRDVLENSAFDPLQEDLIRDHIKKIIGINKTAQDKFSKHRAVNSKDVPDELTHAELSRYYIKDEMPDDPDKYTGCEGNFWLYDDDDGIFKAKSHDDVKARIGDLYTSKYCKRGSDYGSVADLIYIRAKDENFFKNALRGLPGESRFHAVDSTGVIKCYEYTPDLRQRYKLECDPDWNCKTTLFFKFLNDCFPDNQGQKDLIQEIFGALLTGLAAKLQVAILLFGSGANGKSVLLAILDGLISDDLKCSVKPDMFGNEYYRAELAGKIVNIVGEIEKDRQLTADFKDFVGCDSYVTARLPYGRPFRFIPQCGHFFAGNSFPQTRDHSYGQYRRWIIIHFKQTIPKDKRIPDLAKKILVAETPGILAWALDGANRLIQNNYQLTATSEHEELISRWKLAGDSVEAFLNDETLVQMGESLSCSKRDAYQAYEVYCSASGLKPLGVHKFYQRISERYADFKPPHESRKFKGFEIFPQED